MSELQRVVTRRNGKKHRLDVRENILRMTSAKPWSGLPRKKVGCPSLGLFIS